VRYITFLQIVSSSLVVRSYRLSVRTVIMPLHKCLENFGSQVTLSHMNLPQVIGSRTHILFAASTYRFQDHTATLHCRKSLLACRSYSHTTMYQKPSTLKIAGSRCHRTGNFKTSSHVVMPPLNNCLQTFRLQGHAAIEQVLQVMWSCFSKKNILFTYMLVTR
jgi:hypothetical protein